MANKDFYDRIADALQIISGDDSHVDDIDKNMDYYKRIAEALEIISQNPITAYEMAVTGGYTGTLEEFQTDIGNSGTNATNAATSASAAAASATTAANVAGNLAPAYSASATYAIGDHVLYDGGYYVCNTAITTAEAWTAAHWTAAKVGPEITDLKTQLMLEEKGSIEVTDASIIQGSYSANGAPTSSSSRIRVAGFIPVYNGLKIRFTAGTNTQQMFYGKFNANRTFVADGTWLNNGILDVDWDGYIILVYRKTNNADITPSEYDATTTLLSAGRNNFDSIMNDLQAEREDNWYSKYDNSYEEINESGTVISAAGRHISIDENGHLVCSSAVNSSGQRLLRTKNITKTLISGKYKMSFKATLPDIELADGSKTFYLCLGLLNSPVVVSLKTELDGETDVINGRVGWCSAIITISEEEIFCFECYPYNVRGQLSKANPCIIEDLIIKRLNEGDLDVSEMRSQTFNASFHVGATDFTTKCQEFSSLLLGDEINNILAPTDFESFLFFTDPHLLENAASAWEQRCYEFMSQIQKYYNSTPTTFCLCGGDWLGNSDLPNQACFKMGYINGFMESMFNESYLLVGNHDTNYQGKKDSESALYTTKLSVQSIVDLWYRKEKKAYYKFEGAKTTFYCFDTGTENQALTQNDGYQMSQAIWFAESLLNDNSEHIALAMHIIYCNYNAENVDSGIQPLTLLLSQISKAYNDRGSISVNERTYDYSASTGKIEFMIGGHYHQDIIGTMNGIPWIITTNVRHDETLGASFDLVLADYGNRIIRCIRVGSGENRTINLT